MCATLPEVQCEINATLVHYRAILKSSLPIVFLKDCNENLRVVLAPYCTDMQIK